ncbi:hypothetical protein VKI21_00975 [Cyanobacterium aponinum UTEX 3222]|uniref:hypothetical protein n=1 Tax=Cyanobacterium aponinum TaxID=379064 RepID=UPI00308B3CF5|nr:hypothetical protein VKI21_00975 [Cyanobacterium aponinum UTEX 3222]
MTTLNGQVIANGEGIRFGQVLVYKSDLKEANLVGQTTTNGNGSFQFNLDNFSEDDLFYIVASESNAEDSEVILINAIGNVNPNSDSQNITINERTTIASTYALAQFISDEGFIFGPSPGLDNAFSIVPNIANIETGEAGVIIANEDNEEALLIFNTLVNTLSASIATEQNRNTLFDITTLPDGDRPESTFEALFNLAEELNQTLSEANARSFFRLAESASNPLPMLEEFRTTLPIPLHYTAGGMYAVGRMAFDSQGNAWIANNWDYQSFLNGEGDRIPASQITVLNPAGEPILGSPIIDSPIPDTSLVNGVGYGVAVGADDKAWFANYGNGSIVRFTPDFENNTANLDLWSSAGIQENDNPQGIAIDQEGNLWIPNSGGFADLDDLGSVTVYPQGNPSQAVTFTNNDVIGKPFNITIDNEGLAWVTNDQAGNSSVTILDYEDGEIKLIDNIPTNAPPTSPPFPHTFGTPRTVAFDTEGNAWVTNWTTSSLTFIDKETKETQEFPLGLENFGLWGLSVDSGNQVWAGGFDNFSLVLLNQENSRNSTVFESEALQHITAVQVDPSGNIWLANNWTRESSVSDPENIVGGDGVVQFVGLADPVEPPLIGTPVDPADKPENLLTTTFNRFQNSDRPGTYLYANETESEVIRRDFTNFVEEGFAFKASSTENDTLIRLNRFQNTDVPGTYLYASEEESISIRENNPNFVEEGIAFYAYDADANMATDFYRFQNTQQPGTYIYVTETEKNNILENFPQFTLEGLAFEALT